MRRWLVLAGVLILVIAPLYSFRIDPRCSVLLTLSRNDVSVPLPENCVETAEAPADKMVQYLEGQRRRRQFIFKSWIVCKGSVQVPVQRFSFENDPHWLPSYNCCAYQFRRTVIILPEDMELKKGSPVAGEVTIMPWRRYMQIIAGECQGKFSVWR